MNMIASKINHLHKLQRRLAAKKCKQQPGAKTIIARARSLELSLAS